MNLKVRFTILFASFVSLILLISTVTIYILYSNFRVQEFYRRINKETLISYNLFIENKLDTSTLKKSIAQNELALIDFYIGIYDSNKKMYIALQTKKSIILLLKLLKKHKHLVNLDFHPMGENP
jgi:ABC-type lipoprotein release transport system permease subunit